MEKSPRFGNRDRVRKEKPKKMINEELQENESITLSGAEAGNNDDQVSFIDFINEGREGRKTLATRQVLFRLPEDTYRKIEKLKGNYSMSHFYVKLTEYCLSISKFD